MSGQENERVARAVFECFGRGDMEGMLALVDEGVVWRMEGDAGVVPYAGERRGHAGVVEFFQRLGGNVEFESFEPREFVAQGDKVIALGTYRWRVKQTGREYGGDWAHVFTVRDGQIKSFHEYMDSDAAGAAFA